MDWDKLYYDQLVYGPAVVPQTSTVQPKAAVPASESVVRPKASAGRRKKRIESDAVEHAPAHRPRQSSDAVVSPPPLSAETDEVVALYAADATDSVVAAPPAFAAPLEGETTQLQKVGEETTLPAQDHVSAVIEELAQNDPVFLALPGLAWS